MPRGAAGAIRDAGLASDSDTFVIADGTSIPSVDLPGLLAIHAASGALVTVVVHSEPGRNGRPGLEAPTGIYVFSRQALDYIPATGFYDIKENLIPQLHKAGKQVAACSTPAASPRVLDSSSYLAVNEWVVEHLIMNASHPEGYVRSGSALIHSDAVVADDAVFVGPVLVGPGVHIHSRAVLVGPTSIGREATIGTGVLVSRSAVWRRCVLRNQAVADRCILADDTVIAANAEAFRAVMWTNVLGESETTTVQAAALRETSPLELLRRMGRSLLGASWSRSTAAQ
jgi:NDP-sugar pyrophosphorylase family protein